MVTQADVIGIATPEVLDSVVMGNGSVAWDGENLRVGNAVKAGGVKIGSGLGVSVRIAATLAALKALDTANLYATYARGLWAWTAGDFSGSLSDTSVVASTGTAATAGAWVRVDRIRASLPFGDCAAALTSLCAAASTVVLPWRFQPYQIGSSVLLNSGQRIIVEAGAVIQPTFVPSVARGIFEADGKSDVIVSFESDASFNVVSSQVAPYLYVLRARSASKVRLYRARSRNCARFFTIAQNGDGTEAGYANVVTSGTSANVTRDVIVDGGGAEFDAVQPAGFGADLIGYAFDVEIRNTVHRNVSHGCQSLGGDANPSGNGAIANERKCGRIRHLNVQVIGCGNGGIWGSMVDGFEAEFCALENEPGVGDVGFDAEGCFNFTVTNSRVRGFQGGCLSTFFLCRNVEFRNVHAVVTKKENPLYRCYNSTQSAVNESVRIIGGRFTCTDATGPGSIDADAGPIREFVLTGAKLINVVARADTGNLNRVIVSDNQFTYPDRMPAAFVAITTGGGEPTNEQMFTSVTRNRFGGAKQPDGTRLAILKASSFNGPPRLEYSSNSGQIECDSGSAGIRLAWQGGNSGVVGAFIARDNTINGTIETTSSGAAAPGIFTLRENITTSGVVVTATAV